MQTSTDIAHAGTEAPVILTFLHSFEPGGVERIALRMAAHWQQAGAAAPVFMGRNEGAMSGQFADALAMDYAPQSHMPVRHFETVWMIVHLFHRIQRERPDLLFAAGNSYAIVAVALKLLLGKSCPPIAIKISNDLVRRDMGLLGGTLYRWWLRIQGRFIDRFIAMTDALAEQIAQETGVARARIEIIANPSLEAAASHAPLTDRTETDRSFCAVGRITRQKNLPLLLRAFAAAKRAGDRLTLYGQGPELAALHRLASRLGIAGAVHFAGHVGDVRAQLHQHDVLLLSSHYEGMPSVVIEALEAGLHIVASDCCCSMAGLLDEDVLGTLVPAGDEIAFAAAVAAAPKGQRNMARAAAIADMHRIDRVAPLYLSLFAHMHANAERVTDNAPRPRSHPRPALMESI